jgi:hypothetical protein
VFLLGVHSSSDKLPGVELGFYEVRILGKGIRNSWGLREGNIMGLLS